MNNKSLQDLVKGCYGRKILYTDVETITADNIVNVVGDCIGNFYYNKTIIEYLWRYYKGDQPVLYRVKVQNADITNKIVENHAYEIVQFKVGQTYGEPIQFISRKDDDEINRAVDALNDYLVDANKQEKDIKAGEWQSATGTSFKAVRFSNGEIPFQIVAPTPMNTCVIYNRSTEEPVIAVQELKDEDGRWYKLCYTDNYSCKIQNGVVSEWKLHAFGSIPIVEFPNNHERISDIELVIGILDAINNMQSNRMDGIEQFVQYWVKFVNCEIDQKTFEEMKMSHALTVKSNNKDNKADVEIMTQELNQSQCQVAKDDLWDNALAILAIPNRESQNSGGDTQGAVSLRAGWDFSKTRAKLKDPIVKSAEKRLAKVVLNVIRVKENDLKLSMRDFDVQINHSPQDNMYTKSQTLYQLLECGIHPLIAIKTVGLWGDAEKTFLLSKPYIDVLWKTIDDAEEQEQKAQEIVNQLNKQQNKTATE
ncbi:phage portal protein [Roseburia hominis]|uniref:phage portal protein n=1 Tax=Roseburia hominis TaxID=301301 RepID=UPI001C0281DE|nr:phage portal protein [Roseburia hominis]MBT9667115.1 phage portal protein [Roseburia hominis]